MAVSSTSGIKDGTSLFFYANELQTTVSKFIENSGKQKNILVRASMYAVSIFKAPQPKIEVSESPRTVGIQALANTRIEMIKKIKKSLALFVEHITHQDNTKKNRPLPEDLINLMTTIQKGFDQLNAFSKYTLKIRGKKMTLFDAMENIYQQPGIKNFFDKKATITLQEGWKSTSKNSQDNYEQYKKSINRIYEIGWNIPGDVVLYSNLVCRANNELTEKDHELLFTTTTRKLITCYRMFIPPTRLFEIISQNLISETLYKTSKAVGHRPMCVEQQRNMLHICRKWLSERTNRELYICDELLAIFRTIIENKLTDPLAVEEQVIFSKMVDSCTGKRRLTLPAQPEEKPINYDTLEETTSESDLTEKLEELVLESPRKKQVPVDVTPQPSLETVSSTDWRPPTKYPNFEDSSAKTTLEYIQTQLYSIAARRFIGIKPLELINYIAVPKNERTFSCPNLLKAIESFNVLGGFVAKEILCLDDKEIDIQEIHNRYYFYYRLARLCQQKGDFLSLYAISTLLTNPLMPKSIKACYANEIRELDTLVSPAGNNNRLRKEMEHRRDIFIPCLVLFTKDMEFFDKGNKHAAKEQKAVPKYKFNIEYLNTLYEYLRKIETQQEAIRANAYYRNTSAQRHILASPNLDELNDRLYARRDEINSYEDSLKATTSTQKPDEATFMVVRSRSLPSAATQRIKTVVGSKVLARADTVQWE